MKFRRPTGLSIFFIALGLGLFVLSRRPLLLGLLNFIHHSTTWEKLGDTFSFILVVYGFLFFALGIFCTIISLKFSTLWLQVGQSIKNLFPESKRTWTAFIQYHAGLGPLLLWAFLALIVGTCVRAYFLSQPMRGDEAFSFLNYANKDLLSLFNYTEINDHVFHNLLVKASTLIWGGSPAAIRLPVFLAGIAAIFLVFYLARALDSKSKNAGIFAALGTAVFPYLILFSTNARGYAIITILVLAVALVGLRFASHPSKQGIAGLALLSALGMLTIPVMVIPLAGIFLWLVCLLLINKVSLKAIVTQFILPYGILSGVFTFVFYTPVILASNGLAPIISNKFVKPQTWSDFFTNLLPQTQNSIAQLFRDIPVLVLLVVGVLFLAGIYHSFRVRNRALLLLMPLLLFGAALPMLVQRQIPYARTWSFIVPFLLLLADFGLNAILERIPGWVQILVNTLVVLLVFCFAVNLMSQNVITAYPDTSAFPEAPFAVQYLKPIFKPDDALRITSTANWSVYYYFWYYHIPFPTAQAGQTSGRIFYIVKKSHAGGTQNMATSSFIKLLDIGDMALYQRVGK